MPDQRHVIKRQVLQLAVRHDQDAHTLTAEVSRLYRQCIVPLIDRYCTELSSPDRLHRIESVEVDLGTVDAHNLEEDLLVRAGPALRLALATQIRAQEQADASSDRTPITQSQLELLACFARTGSLPWWVDTSQPGLIDACLRDLSDHHPEALRRLLHDVAREPHSLSRIVHHVAEDRLVELVGMLLPRFMAPLRQDARTLVILVERCGPTLDRRPTQLRHSVWLNLLSIAGLGGQQYDTLQTLYRAVLQRVAADVGTTYGKLLAGLQGMVPVDDLNGNNELTDELDRTGRAMHRPIDADAIQRVLGSIDEMAAQQTLAPSDHHRGAAGLSQLRVAVQSSQEEFASDRFVGDADELFINNAGLVILWPFLSHFFAHVALLDEKRFKDAAARQRAVGLLQYLATGDAVFPEYLLPLNKVLCGMEVTEVFDFGASLAEPETEECTNLLHAVIAQAPILRDMSPTGFRGSFLLRRGMLSTRDGAWLLHVERETYDVVLDRFPWTIQWVKLPWMEAPLRVEW